MRLKTKIIKDIKEAAKPVLHTEEEKAQLKEKGVVLRTRPLMRPVVMAVIEPEPREKGPTGGAVNFASTEDSREYITLDVKGSRGQIYKIVIPRSYYKLVPKEWEWNEQRYRVAEYLSAGYPMTKACELSGIPSRSVVYGWLQHPEFREHVDGIIAETGFASKRERIAGLTKVTQMIYDKLTDEFKDLKMTDKSVGAILSGLQLLSKQIAQEKEEFVETTNVNQNMNISGGMVMANVDVTAMMGSKSAEERAKLEAEFNAIGDSIIRNITGEKEYHPE
jgi:hypothetical protein